MTERTPEDQPRLDLRSLDVVPDPVRIDAIVGAVMHRVRSDEAEHERRHEDLAALRRARRYLLAAAAVFAFIATASVLTSSRRTNDFGQGADVVARWAEALHVPTNGELLVIYQGYRP